MRTTIVLLILGFEVSASDLSRALRDPLSYAPAAAVGVAGSLDWASSQRYLQQGWLESNPRYTRSGNTKAEPIDAAAGYHRIVFREALPVFAISVGINTFSYWVEHRTSRWFGRALRWAAAGALTSATTPVFRQWRRNEAGRP